MEKNVSQTIIRKRKRKIITYLDKYNALQNDNLSINELQVLNEMAYEPARQEMLRLIGLIEEYNKANPNEKYRVNTNPYRVPKKFVIDLYKIDETYIFKKAKEELQLKSLIS